MWLEQARRLAQDGVRGGFTPGEAAGCLLLGRRRLGTRLKRRPLATISGAAVHHDTQLRDSEAGSFGLAMSEAVLDAAAGLSLPAQAADTVYCDINGERYRSEEWGLFATRAHAALRSLQYETFCGSIGDVGAAFGAIAGIVAAQSFARGHARGPRALVMAGSDSGARGAMFLHDPRLEGRA
jgi:3-oxoacyl-(acyl-carrier-protein) synthase